MVRINNYKRAFGHISPSQKTINTVIVIVVILVLLSLAFYKVDPGEEGVVRRFGKVNRVTDEGLHLRIPLIEKVDTPKVQEVKRIEIGFRTIKQGPPAVYRDVPEEALMLTGDENIIDVNLSVQYRISDSVEYLFNVWDVERMVRQVSEAALRQVIGSHSIDDVIAEGKQEIQQETRDKIQEMFEKYQSGLLCLNTQLQDVIAPREVDAAFKDVASAREDKERMTREAEGYENEIIPKARGDATRMIREAQADSLERVQMALGDVARFNAIYKEYRRDPQVTRARLYIETMEEILPGLKKYIISTEGKGSITNVLGLPEVISGKSKGGVVE